MAFAATRASRVPKRMPLGTIKGRVSWTGSLLTTLAHQDQAGVSGVSGQNPLRSPHLQPIAHDIRDT
eukprot:8591569-Alexandrium_andersonii.AAC.1